MGKQIVVCLDGTNNKVKSADNTNVLRTYQLLRHNDPERQISFYQPGVGTFSSPGAWTTVGRWLSKVLGLAFGFGLRQNLGNAYAYLMNTYEPGDEIFIFGFSRGAYTARALSGMLAAFGLFRPGAENLIPYAISAMSGGNADTAPRTGPVATIPVAGATETGPTPVMTRQASTDPYWSLLFEFSDTFARRGANGAIPVPVRFLGLWDTVEAAGTLRGTITWPYTRHLPHVEVIRHAMAIDEWRRPFASYPVSPVTPEPGLPVQDLQEVWFSGVHSDVGGMFPTGARLSDIPLKWIAQEAVRAGLLVDPTAFSTAQEQVTADDATGAIHTMPWIWLLAGGRRLRKVPPGATVHGSVADRLAAHPTYAKRVPADHTIADTGWVHEQISD
jgi:uncharacterized protein (DUF2235 family)